MAEPGRYLVADAGTLHAEVVLVSEHDASAPASQIVLAGPTCDSADLIYDKAGYFLHDALQVGEVIRIAATGAYSTSYSVIGFNGFAPLAQGYINVVALKEPAV